MPPKAKATGGITRSTQLRNTRAHPQGSPVALAFPIQKRKATRDVSDTGLQRDRKRRRQEAATNLSDAENLSSEEAESNDAPTLSDAEHSHDEALESPQDEAFTQSDINHPHSEALTFSDIKSSQYEALEIPQDGAFTQSDIDPPQDENRESLRDDTVGYIDIQRSPDEGLDSSHISVITYPNMVHFHDEDLQSPQDDAFTHSDNEQHHSEVSMSSSGANFHNMADDTSQNEAQRFFTIDHSQNMASDSNYLDNTQVAKPTSDEIDHPHDEESFLSDSESAHREASIFSGSKSPAFETDQEETSAVNDIESSQDRPSAVKSYEIHESSTPNRVRSPEDRTSAVHHDENHQDGTSAVNYTERPQDEEIVNSTIHRRDHEEMKRFRLSATFRENYLGVFDKPRGNSPQKRSPLKEYSPNETQGTSQQNQSHTAKSATAGVGQELNASLLTKENIEQLQRDQRNFYSLSNIGRPRHDDRPPSIHDEDFMDTLDEFRDSRDDSQYRMLRTPVRSIRKTIGRPPIEEKMLEPTSTVERLLPEKNFIEWNRGSKAMFVVQAKESESAAPDSQLGPCMTNLISIYSPSLFPTSRFTLEARSLTNIAIIDAVSASINWFEKDPQHAVPTASEMHEILEKFHQAKNPTLEAEPKQPSPQVPQQDRKRRSGNRFSSVNKEGRLDRKVSRTPKRHQEHFRSAHTPLPTEHEEISNNGENQEPELEVMETDEIRPVSTDQPSSIAQQQHRKTSWASALGVSAIGNILRTPINFLSRRNRGAATDSRSKGATSVAAKHERPGHISQAPATVANPKANWKESTRKPRESRGSRATYRSQTPTPIPTYQFPMNGKPDGHLPLHLRGLTYYELPPEWQAVSQHMKPTGSKVPEPNDPRAGYTEEFKEILRVAEITRTKRLKEEAAAAEKKKLQAASSPLKRSYQAYAADEENEKVDSPQQGSGRSTFNVPSSSDDDDSEQDDRPQQMPGAWFDEQAGRGYGSPSKKARLDPGINKYANRVVKADFSNMWPDDDEPEPAKPDKPATYHVSTRLDYSRDMTPEEFGDPHRARPVDPTFLPNLRPVYDPPGQSLIRKEAWRSAFAHRKDQMKPNDASQRLWKAREKAKKHSPKKPSPLWETQNMSPQEKGKAYTGGWGGEVTDPEVIAAVMAIPENELYDYFADCGKENVAPVE